MTRAIRLAAALLLAAAPALLLASDPAPEHGAAKHEPSPPPAHAAPAPAHAEAEAAAPAHAAASHAVAGEPPAAALRELMAGNARFVQGQKGGKALHAARRKELAKGQHPRAVVVSCSDSRVPPEHLFDQGLGEIFVVRLAGNIVDRAALGSIEYAAEHLGTQLVLVLGHRSCGAVTAVVQGTKPEGNLGAVIRGIRPAVRTASKTHSGPGLLNAAIDENAYFQAEMLQVRSPVLRHLAAQGKLQIAVGVYDLASGKVDLLPARAPPPPPQLSTAVH